MEIKAKGGIVIKTVYFGGDILTMEDGPAPEAILVEDGVIRQLGTAAELLRLPGAEPKNLRGRTLLPAFIDPHSHLTAYAPVSYTHLDVYKRQLLNIFIIFLISQKIVKTYQLSFYTSAD